MIIYTYIRDGKAHNNLILCNLADYYESASRSLLSYRTQLYCMAPLGIDVTSNQVRGYEESTTKEVITG